MNPNPVQPQAYWSGPPETKVQLRSALTRTKARLFHIAGRGMPCAWK